MAFPTLRSEASGNSGSTKASSHSVTLPTGHASGDLLILTMSTKGATATSTGWTVKGNAGGAAACHLTGLVIVDTGSLGSSVTVTLSASQAGVWTVHCYQTGTWEGTLSGVEVSADANGNSTAPDPASLTPSWGAADTAWLAVASTAQSNNSNHSAYPASYVNTNNIDFGNKESNLVQWGTRENNTATEDTAAFTTTGGGLWGALTWAIDPGTIPAVTGDFTADAIVLGEQTGSVASDAILLGTIAGATTADAWIEQTIEGSTTADAIVLGAVSASLAADAIVLGTQSSSFQAAAIKFDDVPGTDGAFSADAIILGTESASLSADALVLAAASASLSADALVLATDAGSLAADAFVQPYFFLDAVMASDGYELPIDAVIDSVGRCVWTTPGDLVAMPDQPELAFNMPEAASGSMHFLIEIDTDPGFGSPTVYQSPGSGWEFWDGDSWEPIPDTGVLVAFLGNEARYTVQSALSIGVYYRRVRAGVLG